MEEEQAARHSAAPAAGDPAASDDAASAGGTNRLAALAQLRRELAEARAQADSLREREASLRSEYESRSRAREAAEHLREQALRSECQVRLQEAQAAVHHFASQVVSGPPPAPASPTATGAARSLAPVYQSPLVTAPPPMLPRLVPAAPSVPLGQLVPSGVGWAAVYGATVSARHDAAVYHALGYDSGDLIRQSTEAAARQRELERAAVLRPMVPRPGLFRQPSR